MDASDVRYPALQELSAYWLQHPHASDTLEGICRWWLSSASSSTPVVVEQALAWLVERGVVVSHRAADGRVRYRLSDEARSRQS
jgi:hypothetical protein